jgi:hypothetical protein
VTNLSFISSIKRQNGRYETTEAKLTKGDKMLDIKEEGTGTKETKEA